jgi:two-component system response regulator FixJ
MLLTMIRTCLARCSSCSRRTGLTCGRSRASDDADCFVIDYKMPNMNGLDLATRLRNRDVSAPIILITGYLDESLPDRAAAAGVLYVLRKPHLEESLPGQIRGVLGGPGSCH